MAAQRIRIPTRAEWDKAHPFDQGFMSYSWSAHPGSEIPNEKECPHRPGTAAHAEFQRGVQAAVICAQDSEE